MVKPLYCLAAALSLATLAAAENWPSWRGPTANGHTAEKNLPVKWSPTENVRWKLPLPSPGNSTPVVWGDRVFITQSLDAGGQQRAVICIDRKDGKVLWQKAVPFEGKESTHADNPYCSASPVTDGERVVASHGSAGVVCYDFSGKELWRRDLGRFEHIWGNAASPVLYQDLVILNCGPGERTFLIALDKKTGKDVWKVDEPGGKYGHDSKEWLGSWSTPVVTHVGDHDELIMSWPETLKGYNPRTGELLWSAGGLTRLVYTSPVVTPEAVVAMSGYGGSAIGVRLGGKGDVTQSHRLWHTPRAPQRIGSGVVVGDHLYVANATGVAECVEWKTGKSVWTERLGSGSWSNMVHSDGKLYVTDLRGETFVLAAKPQFELIARNPLGEKTLSSIAVSNGDLYIRTYQHLWCIGTKE